MESSDIKFTGITKAPWSYSQPTPKIAFWGVTPLPPAKSVEECIERLERLGIQKQENR
jgi:hypothetical protein